MKIDDPDVLQKDGFAKLVDSGIVLKTEGLSSPFAKRYLFNVIFPSRSEQEPSSVVDLVVRTVSRMSASLLTRTIVPESDDFPKETVSSNFSFLVLLQKLPPQCRSVAPVFQTH